MASCVSLAPTLGVTFFMLKKKKQYLLININTKPWQSPIYGLIYACFWFVLPLGALKLCTLGLTSPIITGNKDNDCATHLCAGELILRWFPEKISKKKNLYS